ncbi:hypothetical protein AACH06_29180 [Ideonella sp. DXS29W]|uniref:Uncharacterized protein n=1 Tax=Ideonella lacteola TaxID=2984193 RepID=A0ABU9BZN0_9BURK
MTWNYRVMVKDGELAIYEVFYRADGSVEGWTENPVFPRASTLKELQLELQRYAEALNKEVLPHARPAP